MQTFRNIAFQTRGGHRVITIDQGGGVSGTPPTPAPPGADVVLSPVPQGGGRIIIDRRGGHTVVTSAALPPEVMRIATMAEETAFGLLGLIVVIVILGPFARMIARRMEKRPQVMANDDNARMLQQQLLQLQQSMDAMSVEVERISESQRFQSKLLFERKEA